MKKLFTVALAAILLCSCGNSIDKTSHYESADYAMAVAVAEEERGAEAIPVDAPADDKKKIIREGRMGLLVDDVHAAKTAVAALTAKYGGYMARESYSGSEWEATYSLTIRVPNAGYEAFVAEAGEGVGRVQYKEINATDVSEQYYDIQTRLGNKRAYLERYQELVRRAGTIAEILEVEEQVRVLEEEIESAEGRLRYLGDQVTYSTLHLDISNRKVGHTGRDESFLGRLKYSLSLGWDMIVEVFLVLLRTWPLIIIAVVVVFFVRRRSKKTGAGKK